MAGIKTDPGSSQWCPVTGKENKRGKRKFLEAEENPCLSQGWPNTEPAVEFTALEIFRNSQDMALNPL